MPTIEAGVKVSIVIPWTYYMYQLFYRYCHLRACALTWGVPRWTESFSPKLAARGRGSARCRRKDERGAGVARTGVEPFVSSWAPPRHHADPSQSADLSGEEGSMESAPARRLSLHFRKVSPLPPPSALPVIS